MSEIMPTGDEARALLNSCFAAGLVCGGDNDSKVFGAQERRQGYSHSIETIFEPLSRKSKTR